MAGRRLGKYELRERIGAGGMAEVYRAEVHGAAGFRRHVALKMIRPEWAEDAEFLRMFVDEARLSAALHHPNIVQTLDFGHEAGSYFLAMELCDGASLGACLRHLRNAGRSFDRSLAAHVAAEIAAALDHAHRARGPDGQPLHIVHRDVNPANVILTRHGAVKLGDFGIAKAAGRATMTEAGALKGKIPYMSPEQAWGRPLDPRSDVYALALLLHEMLSGRRAIEAETEMAALEKARVGRTSPLPDDVPAALAAVVRGALSVDPAARPDGAGALREALLPFAAAPGRDLAAELSALVRVVQPRPSGAMYIAAALPDAQADAGYRPPGTEVATPPARPFGPPEGADAPPVGTEVATLPPGRAAIRTIPVFDADLTGIGPLRPARAAWYRPAIAGVIGLVLIAAPLALRLTRSGVTPSNAERSPSSAVSPTSARPAAATAAEPAAAAAPGANVARAAVIPGPPSTAPSRVSRRPQARFEAHVPAKAIAAGGTSPDADRATAGARAAGGAGGGGGGPSDRATLRIQVEPWGDVWLDGRALGQTPLRPVEVDAGEHTVRARHPTLGERSVHVTAAAGEGRLVRLDLAGAAP